MCRFLVAQKYPQLYLKLSEPLTHKLVYKVYKGKLVLIGDVVEQPENSLIFQSRDAAFHPGCNDPNSERNIRVNGTILNPKS